MVVNVEDMQMTLNQLEYFCAVCRYHSMTRAANELHISQPTISVAIKDLEAEFDIKLFEHGKNKITITSEGEELYQKAENLLKHSEELYNDFSSLSASIKPIKIGIPPLLSTVFFPKLTDEFKKVSNTPIILFEYASMKARDLVEKGQLDTALVNLDFYDVDHFDYNVLMEDKYIYAVSKAHKFACEPYITFEMLQDEPIILYHTDSVQNRTIISRFHTHNMTPNIVMHCSQLITIQNYIRDNKTGAFLYDSLKLLDNDFVKIPIDPVITSKIGFIWKKGRHLSNRVKKLHDFVIDSGDIFTS